METRPQITHVRRILVFGVIAFTLSAFVRLPSAQKRPAKELPKDLLEIGFAAKVQPFTDVPKEFCVVTYNIRWRTGEQLKQIGEWLKNKQPLIVALQEVDRGKQRTGKNNNARALAESLGMYYAWAAPPGTKDGEEEETGCELLSALPLADVTRIVLPHRGPGGRQRVALGATVKLGQTNLRFYSVHSETRISEAKKLDQYRAVLTDLARFPRGTPAIVMGDLNSWEPAMVDEVRKLFTQEGFTTPFPDSEKTFRRGLVFFDLTLKLDWMWLRGLSASSFGIDRSITVSDHFPLWTVASTPSHESSQR